MCHTVRVRSGPSAISLRPRSGAEALASPILGWNLPWPRVSPCCSSHYGPKVSESLTGNFLVSGPIQNPLPPNGTWDGGALQGVLLCRFSCLPHASNPTAACGSQEESWTLSLGRGGVSSSWSPTIAHDIHPFPPEQPRQETRSPFDR